MENSIPNSQYCINSRDRYFFTILGLLRLLVDMVRTTEDHHSHITQSSTTLHNLLANIGDESAWISHFRFSYNQIVEIFRLIPANSKTEHGCKVSIRTVLVGLHHLAMTNRNEDMVSMLGISRTQVSLQNKFFVNWLVKRSIFRHLINKRFTMRFLYPDRLGQYQHAINNKTGLISSIFCFVDCTLIEIARPGNSIPADYSKILYNGKDRIYALKYQGIVLPDGMLLSFDGCYPGSFHDALVIKLSDILEVIPENGGVIYGDAAYSYLYYPVIGPFMRHAGRELSDAQKNFNRVLSSSRVSIENFFCIFKNSFRYLSNKEVLVLGVTPIDLYIKASVILSLIRTLFNKSNSISNLFGLTPPNYEDIKNNLITFENELFNEG